MGLQWTGPRLLQGQSLGLLGFLLVIELGIVCELSADSLQEFEEHK